MSRAYPTETWKDIETRYCAGDDSLIDLAKEYNIPYNTVRMRSKNKRWVSKKRVVHAITRTDLLPTDPAKALADKWKERNEQLRESTYFGAKRALDTFFLLNPVPQDFAEAEKAFKILEKVINPEVAGGDSLNIALLTNNFIPTLL
jgi:hypothetical protein